MLDLFFLVSPINISRLPAFSAPSLGYMVKKDPGSTPPCCAFGLEILAGLLSSLLLSESYVCVVYIVQGL